MPEAATQSSMPAVDHETLRTLEEEVAAGIPEIMLDLLDTFINDTPHHIQVLAAYQPGDDPAQVMRSAHSLKSSAATFGAHPLAQLCARIEGLAREGNLEELPQMVEQVQAEYRTVKAILEEERARLAE